MVDQAQKLREMIGQKDTGRAPVVTLEPKVPRPRTLAVTSGKGGVGKTNLVVNLAIAMARRGKKILIVDADLSLANIDVLLGLQPQYNLSHVIWGQKRLGEVVVEGPHGIRVVPASSGVQELAMLTEYQLAGLVDQFSELDPTFDMILIDTAAGLSDSVLSFVLSADEVVLVTTPEPTAYVDAYQMLKTLHFSSPEKKVHLVVNMAITEKEGRTTSEFLQKMASQFLRHDLHPLGCIQKDPDVPSAIRVQKAFLEESPHCPASHGIQSLATRILNLEKDLGEEIGGIGIFWKRFAEYLKLGGK